MRDGANLKAAVQKFWNNKPGVVKNTSTEPGTQAFYEETEAYRYQEEFHIPAVAEFDQHPDEKVLECGCGLGTDGRQLARGKASYTGCDLSFRSLSAAIGELFSPSAVGPFHRGPHLARKLVQENRKNLQIKKNVAPLHPERPISHKIMEKMPLLGTWLSRDGPST